MKKKIEPTRIREEWLLDVAHLIMPIIEEKAQIPVGKFRVSCSFPGSCGLKGNKTRTRGQCWSAELSADKHAEVFISPVEADPREVDLSRFDSGLNRRLSTIEETRLWDINTVKISNEKQFDWR